MNIESLEHHFWVLFFCHSPSPYLSLHVIYFVPGSGVQMQPYVATQNCCCTMAWDHSREPFSASDLKRKKPKKQKFTIAQYLLQILYIHTYIHNIVCKYTLYIVHIYLYTYIVLSVSFWHIFNQCQSITEPDHEEEMIWNTGDYSLQPQSCQGLG